MRRVGVDRRRSDPAPGGLPRRRIWATWAVCNAVGVAIVVLVDDDARLVTLGRDHGPSPSEAVGVLLVIVGWITLDVSTLRSWPRTRWSTRAERAAVALMLVGVGALVPTVVWGSGATWLVGATLLGGTQVAAALSIGPEPGGPTARVARDSAHAPPRHGGPRRR